MIKFHSSTVLNCLQLNKSTTNFIITENTSHVLWNFSFVKFREFHENIQTG